MAIQPEIDAIRRILAPIHNPVVLECGAECGSDMFMFEEAAGKPFQHILVEPDPRNAQHILDNCGPSKYAGRTPRPLGQMRRLILGAVSDVSGFQPFHFSENAENGNHASGSLLEPTGHLKAFPEISFPSSGYVMCYTLDEIFEREWLKRVDLLWSDVQGAEAGMIRGGPKTLAHTRYLFMEVEGVELYRGEALRDDLIAMLPGWKLIGDFGCNILMENLGFLCC